MPPPGTYNIESMFSRNPSAGKFAPRSSTSRQLTTAETSDKPLSTLRRESSITRGELPGPGSYNIRVDFLSVLKRPTAFRIGVKPKVTSILQGRDPDLPDVGTYNHLTMTANGRYPLAKFANVKNGTFGQRTDLLI